MDNRQIKTRNTVNQKRIIDILRANADKHLTHADISALLAKAGHNMGQATIYRVLRKLEVDGLVNKYVLDGQPACYQYLKCEDCTTHCHAICTECGAMEHIDIDLFGAMSDKVASAVGFVMDLGRTVLYGICRECSSNNI